MPIFTRHRRALAAALAVCVLSLPALGQDNASAPQSIALRVATFNIEDLRTAEFKGEPSDRVRAAAEIIQRIRPNVILINEIAYDMPGGPGYEEAIRRAATVRASRRSSPRRRARDWRR